ncbi:MAG: hypothetical protein D3923_10685 [Candidatus Electrothrix sp. AR3]|nr:hypothetical protein [Candidatus Electrothrix sp. AR3]
MIIFLNVQADNVIFNSKGAKMMKKIFTVLASLVFAAALYTNASASDYERHDDDRYEYHERHNERYEERNERHHDDNDRYEGRYSRNERHDDDDRYEGRYERHDDDRYEERYSRNEHHERYDND